jgi:hypothetical protein
MAAPEEAPLAGEAEFFDGLALKSGLLSGASRTDWLEALGPLASAAVVRVLDAHCAPVVCLCSCVAYDAAAAAAASAELAVFRAARPPAARLARALAHDVPPPLLAEIARHVRGLPRTPDEVLCVNAAGGLAVAVPECAPADLWVYASPRARKMLRWVSRRVRVAVRGATPANACAPRYLCKMLVATAMAPATRDDVLAAAVAWCDLQASDSARLKNEASPSIDPVRQQRQQRPATG